MLRGFSPVVALWVDMDQFGEKLVQMIKNWPEEESRLNPVFLYCMASAKTLGEKTTFP